MLDCLMFLICLICVDICELAQRLEVHIETQNKVEAGVLAGEGPRGAAEVVGGSRVVTATAAVQQLLAARVEKKQKK